ncbi:MAG: H-NS histone family protein [Tabrizicola sp.]|nr:H-NS histone family protein [Tabrizicola sp.]
MMTNTTPKPEAGVEPKFIESLGLKELEDLRRQIEKAISTAEAKAYQQIAVLFRDEAVKAGLDPEKAIAFASGQQGVKRKRAPSLVRYVHPTDPATTWTGRGRKPGWVKELGVEPSPAV